MQCARTPKHVRSTDAAAARTARRAVGPGDAKHAHESVVSACGDGVRHASRHANRWASGQRGSNHDSDGESRVLHTLTGRLQSPTLPNAINAYVLAHLLILSPIMILLCALSDRTACHKPPRPNRFPHVLKHPSNKKTSSTSPSARKPGTWFALGFDRTQQATFENHSRCQPSNGGLEQ